MNTTPLVARQRTAFALTRLDAAVVMYAVPATLMAWGLATVHDRPVAFLSLIPMVAALALRHRAALAGISIGLSATVLRLSYLGIGASSQVDNTRAAADRAFDGMSPYGVLLPHAFTPPEPYVYGPLGLIWWQPGVLVELIAAVAVTALLISTSSWLTLALYSGLPFSVYLTTTGVNDYSPGLLIAGGLLLTRTRPILGAGLLAVAAALKPYAFAWFVPAVGYGGLAVAATLASVTAVLWAPLLLWGPASFLRSFELMDGLDRTPQNTLTLPFLRWLAIPLTLLGLIARRWEHAVLLGSAAFVTYLFFGEWASLGYWVAVIPAAGMALEYRWTRA
jgi:hypothetical protein